jgi:hypothetical protein
MRAMEQPTSLTSRNERVREMALARTPWRAIALEIGLSITRVRQLRADLRPRRAGRAWRR